MDMFSLSKTACLLSRKLSHMESCFLFFFPVTLDILRIDNLWQFENLTKLQLDNNILEKIEGLESLVQLVWLGKRWALRSHAFKSTKQSQDVAFLLKQD